jgi:hypothetical protein
MSNHFIAQILKDKGPAPAEEIASVLAAAGEHERAHAIFATRMTGKDWRPSRPAFAVVFHRNADGTIGGLVAEIVNRLKEPTNIPVIYDPWLKAMKGWWHLKNPRPFKPGVTLADVPGRSDNGSLRAASTFDGNCTFAYWDFDESPFDALCAPEE